MMDPKCLMFEVHHNGRFNREHRCTYAGGDVAHYPDSFDRDKMSFIEVDGVVESYGYGPGDFIYYNIPNKILPSLSYGAWTCRVIFGFVW
jgi:hypothetical protein